MLTSSYINKTKAVMNNLFKLKYYICSCSKVPNPRFYTYILGLREKYAFLNLSIIYELLLRLEKFILYSLATSRFCFASFHPHLDEMTKSFALSLQQKFICGTWVNGFLSRCLAVQLVRHLKETNCESILDNLDTMPIFVVFTLTNADLFLKELVNYNVPIIIVGINPSDYFIGDYPVMGDSVCFDSIFFFFRLLRVFFSSAFSSDI